MLASLMAGNSDWNPDWAYHGTDAKNLASIARKGLRPRRLAGRPRIGTQRPAVFFTAWDEDAEQLARDYAPVVFRFPAPEKFKTFEGEDEGVEEYYTLSAIPPEQLQLRDCTGKWRPVTDWLKTPWYCAEWD